MDALMERCSVRQFTGEPVSREDLMTLMRAAMAAPSARNQQPWEFFIIQDPARIAQLRTFSPYAGPLDTAGAAIVVCANSTRHLNLGYDLQDCAAATQNLLIRAVELGLGTCWLGGYPVEDRLEKLQQLLDPPEEILPLWVIALGHPAKAGKVLDKFREDRLHFEQW